MTNHDLVNLVLSFIATNWDAGNYPGNHDGEKPVLIDRDESVVYEITDTGTTEVGDATVGTTTLGRDTTFDLTRNNAIAVDGNPQRLETPIGTEYDYEIEDGAHVRIEGVHESEYGHITDIEEFEDLIDELRRTLHVERSFPYPNEGGDEHYHTLVLENATAESSSHSDYYRYDVDVLFRGFEELP